MTYTAIRSPDIRGNEEGGEGLVLNHERGRRQSLYGPSSRRYSLRGAEPSQPYPKKVGRLLGYGGFLSSWWIEKLTPMYINVFY